MNKIGPKMDFWGKLNRERDIQERNIYDHVNYIVVVRET
jgi:hypothetical protein